MDAPLLWTGTRLDTNCLAAWHPAVWHRSLVLPPLPCAVQRLNIPLDRRTSCSCGHTVVVCSRTLHSVWPIVYAPHMCVELPKNEFRSEPGPLGPALRQSPPFFCCSFQFGCTPTALRLNEREIWNGSLDAWPSLLLLWPFEWSQCDRWSHIGPIIDLCKSPSLISLINGHRVRFAQSIF